MSSSNNQLFLPKNFFGTRIPPMVDNPRARRRDELLKAVYYNNKAALRALLGIQQSTDKAEAGWPNPNVTWRCGNTALHIAASKGHARILQMLVDYKRPEHKGCEQRRGKRLVNVDAVNARNQTPLWLAAQNGHTRCVRILLGAGADTTIAYGGAAISTYDIAAPYTPLNVAMYRRKTAAMRALLEAADMHFHPPRPAPQQEPTPPETDGEDTAGLNTALSVWEYACRIAAGDFYHEGCGRLFQRCDATYAVRVAIPMLLEHHESVLARASDASVSPPPPFVDTPIRYSGGLPFEVPISIALGAAACFLRHGASVNSQRHPARRVGGESSRAVGGVTLAMRAVEEGAVESLKAILASGADLTAVDDEGRSIAEYFYDYRVPHSKRWFESESQIEKTRNAIRTLLMSEGCLLESRPTKQSRVVEVYDDLEGVGEEDEESETSHTDVYDWTGEDEYDAVSNESDEDGVAYPKTK